MDISRLIQLSGLQEGPGDRGFTPGVQEPPNRLKNNRGFTPGVQEPPDRLKNNRGFTPGAPEPGYEPGDRGFTPGAPQVPPMPTPDKPSRPDRPDRPSVRPYPQIDPMPTPDKPSRPDRPPSLKDRLDAIAMIPYQDIPLRLPNGRLNPDHPFNYGKSPGDNRIPPGEREYKGPKLPVLNQAESVDEAGMGAPDYNPAKASAGGPGYASMPQQVKLAGDSIWDKEDTNPPMVTITDYEVVEENGYLSVTVEHDGPWSIYTDSGFEKAISDMIGMDVEFSEQGMQEDGRAHLEGSVETESSDLTRLKMLAGVNEGYDQDYADVMATKNQIKINKFLATVPQDVAKRLTGNQAQLSKMSGNDSVPVGEPYSHDTNPAYQDKVKKRQDGIPYKNIVKTMTSR